jgi:hypothetical protein
LSPIFTPSTLGNQLRTAVDAEGTLLPAGGRVVGVGAPLQPDTLVHDAATGGAMPHGGMLASMIQVLTRCSSHARPYHERLNSQPAQLHQVVLGAQRLRRQDGSAAEN